MPFESEITTDSFIGIWKICGRWLVAGIYVFVIVLFSVLLVKRKQKKAVCCSVIAVVSILLVGMFIGGDQIDSVFIPEDVAQFCNELENKLTLDNQQFDPDSNKYIENEWQWIESKDDMWVMFSVYKDNPDYQLMDLDDTYKNTYHGTDNDCKYTFAPAYARYYHEYLFLKTDYIGHIFMQNNKYYIKITYSMHSDSFIDYVSVIYPFLYSKQYNLSYLLTD